MERETGFEPATSTLARSHSTTELFPLAPCQLGQGTTSASSQARRRGLDQRPKRASAPARTLPPRPRSGSRRRPWPKRTPRRIGRTHPPIRVPPETPEPHGPSADAWPRSPIRPERRTRHVDGSSPRRRQWSLGEKPRCRFRHGGCDSGSQEWRTHGARARAGRPVRQQAPGGFDRERAPLGVGCKPSANGGYRDWRCSTSATDSSKSRTAVLA